MYQGKEVWVEWRESIEDMSAFPEIEKVFDVRAEKLAKILSSAAKPKAFRAPDCVGHIRDDCPNVPRYGLVYLSPEEDGQLVSLHELISSRTSFALNARIELARALASSLMYLHAVNWLHKGVRSDSVLFSCNGKSKAKLAEPTLSGFDFSRPDLPDELTFYYPLPPGQELYRHPEQQQQPPARSTKVHDMYSLGLVLAEIALWRPIEDIVGIQVRHSQLRQVRKRMLDEQRDILGTIACHAGESFAEVVRVCIEGNQARFFDDTTVDDKSTVAAELQRFFCEEIIERLDGIKL